MDPVRLFDQLKRKFSMADDRALAECLGLTEGRLTAWKRSGRPLTSLQIANLVVRASEAAVARAQRQMIRPIMEFFPLDAVPSARGVRYELFPTGKDGSEQHQGLRKELSESRGIYLFYDSRGQAIYAGQATRQSLWHEMKSVFNRDRSTQSVFRVEHATRSKRFTPAYERMRTPRRTKLRLDALAAYVSAYAVDVSMICDLEALLVRGFANDLLNTRMERFSCERG